MADSEILIGADWVWCLHCERVWKREDVQRNGWNCPGIERMPNGKMVKCNGKFWDLHAWIPNDWPRVENPDYPAVPEMGHKYPLYGEKRSIIV